MTFIQRGPEKRAEKGGSLVALSELEMSKTIPQVGLGDWADEVVLMSSILGVLIRSE